MLIVSILFLWNASDALAAKKASPPTAATDPLPADADVILRITAESAEILLDSSAQRNHDARSSGRVIPDTPLAFPAIKGAAVRASVRLTRLTLQQRDVSVHDAAVETLLSDDALRIAPLTLTGARVGTVTATLEVRSAAREHYRIASQVRIAGMDGAAVLALLGSQESVSGAKTDAALDLRGDGSTLRDLAGSLNGDVRIVVGPGKLGTHTLDFGGNAFSRVMDTVNPFRKTDRETNLQCAVLRFPIRDGIAVIDHGFGAQTDKVNVIAAGAVNLRDETLDLAIHPRVREGLGISVKATLAEMVRVRGTFADPAIGIDPAGSARTAISLGAAVLTAGGSLVATNLFDAAVATQPCEAALGRVQPSGNKNVVTETLNAPARILDRVFGR